MRVVLVGLLALVAACGAPQVERTIEVDGERITRIPPNTIVWPSIVDSHVHLAYWPVADELARRGIGAVVDLAAPEIPKSSLHVIASGPMLTRPGGYPLDSWGADGYGIGCADAACIDAMIDRIAASGARVLKIALDENGLDPALVPHAVRSAHAKKLKVAVHALSDRAAMLAATAGADLLAHTPVEPLRAETIAAWKNGAVVSTLAAFAGPAGEPSSAIENLRALRAAGTTVLYGTDLGNLRDAGPSEDEISLLARAGLSDPAIVDAMTTTAARYWGLPFGSITVGSEATLLVLERDPREDVRVLLAPRAVWLRGVRQRPL